MRVKPEDALLILWDEGAEGTQGDEELEEAEPKGDEM